MRSYRVLQQQVFSKGPFSLVPIRYEDRLEIMRWRNEQMYHLRQSRPLTAEDQDRYFRDSVTPLFENENPDQLLFSFLQEDKCIGYGGLVHINWTDKNAEISFIMDTQLEKTHFAAHWTSFLNMVETVAFEELKLHKIYTYAFDLRPHLYGVLESQNFTREAVLEEHCYFQGSYKDVVIHSKTAQDISVRKATAEDVAITHEWANDDETRKNSFSSASIDFSAHRTWFLNKLNDPDSHYFICESSLQPAGIVRFDRDRESGNYIIGINIAPGFRGKGLSAGFLKRACREFFSTQEVTVDAYIKKDNRASVRSFEKAHFIFADTLNVSGLETLKYQLKKNGQ